MFWLIRPRSRRTTVVYGLVVLFLFGCFIHILSHLGLPADPSDVDQIGVRGVELLPSAASAVATTHFPHKVTDASVFQKRRQVSGASLRYTPPHQSGVTEVGKDFSVARELLSAIGMPITDFVHLDQKTVHEFVFATASDSSYFPVALDAMATVQKYLPDYKIIFYAIGYLDDVKISKVKDLCNVQYRSFDFRKYPGHVSNLMLYSWKPLIVHELLREFPGVFWIDSSIRFISSNLSIVLSEVLRNDGALTFTTTGHSNFAVTHSDMYKYLPTNLDKMKQIEQREANCILLFRTEIVYNEIIWWWVLCALEQSCMAPIANRFCAIRSGDQFANCHRFDQAALNILIANLFNYDYMKYYASDRVTEVWRYSSGKQNLKWCPAKGNLQLASQKQI